MATSSIFARRIVKEIGEVKADKDAGLQVETLEDHDMSKLRGTFIGPPDTPYEGGTYDVTISVPTNYPFKPPTIRFTTKIWHPNVSSVTGAICLDTLGKAWTPIMNLKSALQSLQLLLSTPEPKDPQDHEVASMMIRNPAEFEHVAREWAVKHANAPRKERGEGSGGATASSIKRKAQRSKENEEKAQLAQYHNYNKDLIDRFVAMGFDVPSVVAAFEYVGIDKNDGQDYELEEAYMGDITARLFGEA
ncbi:hypothetical protein P152DRAFT_308482 [Eremomyces bilateralis CBS 781.70]|uniref:UBC core domain-containing protein n=1 Tax=Eremomyces bilateralis CBS 781.70 TaxID=1392243 RepID=A0A6G1G5M8_9PEZI|nr:uncharacterized protein P152DRAFT_308482 [Eremomyces bilateralis CBS 781.70]KAF1813190.1 hypothetical protein P152DRAFT_308482 [Eremomyces bilateralis CBS 781.70]